jgi:glycosyltransferase involved in cell wall biosynthesis
LAVLTRVWSHHAKRSGYHPVAEGLGVNLRGHHIRYLPTAVSRRAAGDGFDDAYQIAFGLKASGCDRLLVIDGDWELKLIERIRRFSSAKIYAVFHNLPNDLKDCVDAAPSVRIDGAICVARCQLPVVDSIVPPGKAWFVPHGVDTGFFTPQAPRSAAPRVLSVGYNFRDFDTLRRSAEIILRAMPEASVRLIAPRALMRPGLDLGPIELISGVSDERLLDEYRQAWVVLLPLIGSTANNSLLEAMASGTPIVTTDIGGVPDYLDSECGALCPPGDAQAHANAALDLLRDPTRRDKAGHAARLRSEDYAWPKVREQIGRLLT